MIYWLRISFFLRLLLKIHGDFVLISGDTLSNMSLTHALEQHKERRKKDSNAVMTMVIRKSKPSPITFQSRLGTDELFMAIDPDTKQLLYYEDKADHLKGTISLDKMLLADKSSVSVHNDKQVFQFNNSLKLCVYWLLIHRFYIVDYVLCALFFPMLTSPNYRLISYM